MYSGGWHHVFYVFVNPFPSYWALPWTTTHTTTIRWRDTLVSGSSTFGGGILHQSESRKKKQRVRTYLASGGSTDASPLLCTASASSPML
ncbi:hypothetical protein D5086_017523 [Populus alba]|uniref:Uncharacterized protein n=1 Tax=Populus alba TaxID=43335 RepID=A0ACC4BM51_POPAL